MNNIWFDFFCRVKKKSKRPKKRKLIFDENGLKAFATHLKKVRKSAKITQEELSHTSGLTLSQIARIETFRINPTLSTVFKITRALKIDLSELFDFKLPPEK